VRRKTGEGGVRNGGFGEVEQEVGRHTGDQAVAVKVLCLSSFEKHVGFVDEQNATPSASQGKVGLEPAFDHLGGGSQVS
jgi:hypothetical protein